MAGSESSAVVKLVARHKSNPVRRGATSISYQIVAALVLMVIVAFVSLPGTGRGAMRWPCSFNVQAVTRFVPAATVSVNGTTSIKIGEPPHWLPTESLLTFFQTWPVFSHQPLATTSALQSLVKLLPRVSVAP